MDRMMFCFPLSIIFHIDIILNLFILIDLYLPSRSVVTEDAADVHSQTDETKRRATDKHENKQSLVLRASCGGGMGGFGGGGGSWRNVRLSIHQWRRGGAVMER